MENKVYKMDNNSTHAQAGGVIFGIGAYLVHVDWTHFFGILLSTSLWHVMLDVGIQVLKVAAFGFIGGAFGKYGGKFADKYFPKKSKKRSTKSQ